MLLVSGCFSVPAEETPSLLQQVEQVDGEGRRISLDEALTIAEPPFYLIIGRDLLPDGTAASWTILSGDPDNGYRLLFITADGVVPGRWDGKVPKKAIDPREFPRPSDPVPILIYPEVT